MITSSTCDEHAARDLADRRWGQLPFTALSRLRSVWYHRGGCGKKSPSRIRPLVDLAMAYDHVFQTAGPHLAAVAKELMKAQGMGADGMTAQPSTDFSLRPAAAVSPDDDFQASYLAQSKLLSTSNRQVRGNSDDIPFLLSLVKNRSSDGIGLCSVCAVCHPRPASES